MTDETGNQQSTRFSLKDHLFNQDRVAYLASLFSSADTAFDASAFVSDTMRDLQPLELKQRIVHIAKSLERHLDKDFTVAARKIAGALPPPLDPTRVDDDFGDFIFASLGEFVVRNGLEKRHLRLSLRTLKQLTMRFSMEDSIRYFIDAFPDQTLLELAKWASDKNYHVRRLVSEGTRPLLPWSGRLSIEAERALPFLDTLHADPTRYVTRSVANHLNDIAKSKPDLVLERLKRWQSIGLQSEQELSWISSHALRTLVKQGNPRAIRQLGFRSNPAIDVSQFAILGNVTRPGEAIEFRFVVSASRDEKLLIDYVIDFVKADGSRSPKVFKIKRLNLAKGRAVVVEKRHPFRANATTFTLYPGTHRLTLQINGKPFGSLDFEMR